MCAQWTNLDGVIFQFWEIAKRFRKEFWSPGPEGGLDEDCRRTAGGLEENWRRTGGELEDIYIWGGWAPAKSQNVKMLGSKLSKRRQVTFRGSDDSKIDFGVCCPAAMLHENDI